jgi:hypothetical protein
VCFSWEQQGQDLHPAVFAASFGYPAALQAVSMLLLVQTLPGVGMQSSTKTASTASSAASTSSPCAHNTPSHNSASQAAWEFACSHESDISALQQQVLQELGCSSRGLMYAASCLGLSDSGHEQVNEEHSALSR